MVAIKKSIIIPIIVVFVLSLVNVSAGDYLALQGSVTGASSGNVIVEIYDAASGGNLLYNSTDDFNNVINNSRYDILVGNGTHPLYLNFSGTYYLNLNIAGKDMNFNNSDRQVFQSPVGNITVSTPIKTSSTSTSALNVNNMLNISGADGNITTAGSIKLRSSDADDALNVTGGGIFVAGDTVFNRFFNITTTASSVKTNGTVTILNADSDDALNVSAGGSYFGSSVTIGGGTLTSSVPATFSSNDADDALNVSLGGLSVAGGSPGDMPFKVANNGAVQIKNNDADDALNVSAGGSYFSGAVKMDNDVTINNVNRITQIRGKVIMDNNDADDALNITTGGMFVAGNVVFNRFFNITTTASTVRTNGTINILSTDADDALNITSGGMFVAGNVVFNRFFNITTTASSVRTNGTITILGADMDDTLNISTGGAYVRGNATIQGNEVIIGANSITTQREQNHLTIADGGGADKCAYILLYDENAGAHYLFFDTNGFLRMSNTTSSTCSDGQIVGQQS